MVNSLEICVYVCVYVCLGEPKIMLCKHKNIKHLRSKKQQQQQKTAQAFTTPTRSHHYFPITEVPQLEQLSERWAAFCFVHLQAKWLTGKYRLVGCWWPRHLFPHWLSLEHRNQRFSSEQIFYITSSVVTSLTHPFSQLSLKKKKAFLSLQHRSACKAHRRHKTTTTSVCTHKKKGNQFHSCIC